MKDTSSSLCCPLCNRQLPVLSSKKNKPYATCEDCGVQVFVRYPRGIERLREIERTGKYLLRDFIVCKRCDVAVRKSRQKIAHPLFSKSGIYCPECDRLLMETDERWEEMEA